MMFQNEALLPQRKDLNVRLAAINGYFTYKIKNNIRRLTLVFSFAGAAADCRARQTWRPL